MINVYKKKTIFVFLTWSSHMVIKNSLGTYDGYEPVGKIHSKDVEIEFLDPIYDHLENPKLKTVELTKSIRENMIDKMKQTEH